METTRADRSSYAVVDVGDGGVVLLSAIWQAVDGGGEVLSNGSYFFSYQPHKGFWDEGSENYRFAGFVRHRHVYWFLQISNWNSPLGVGTLNRNNKSVNSEIQTDLLDSLDVGTLNE
ncbi:hypothetical protein Salat_2701300 [Sesamum alatum]|uniref:Uncharacterized protein n=1 Tax=Sesamum alatum TaxID=300844 RepID=A0AAE2CBC6_9LAMI|nr:hypothetical protein Salat_2701300 [Sesamum alatum]